MNFEKFNPFKKPITKVENISTENSNGGNVAPIPSESAEPKEVKPKLSLQEEFALLEEKKKEIEELVKGREDYYVNAKNLEEKIIMSGVTEDKAKEIRSQVLEGGKEISDQINEIRKEYGINPTSVEMYSGRLDMILKEVKRIEDNMAPEYRDLSNKMHHYFGDQNSPYLEKLSVHEHSTINNFKTYVLDSSVVPEAQQLSEKIKTLRGHEDSDLVTIKSELKAFRELMNQKVKENTTYKTPGELKDAQIRIKRLIHLADQMVRSLRDAENKEGIFARVKK